MRRADPTYRSPARPTPRKAYLPVGKRSSSFATGSLPNGGSALSRKSSVPPCFPIRPLVVERKIRLPAGSRIDISFHESASMKTWTPPSRSVALISNFSRASLSGTTFARGVARSAVLSAGRAGAGSTGLPPAAVPATAAPATAAAAATPAMEDRRIRALTSRSFRDGPARASEHEAMHPT